MANLILNTVKTTSKTQCSRQLSGSPIECFRLAEKHIYIYLCHILIYEHGILEDSVLVNSNYEAISLKSDISLILHEDLINPP